MPQGIWVIAEQKDGKLKKVSLELLSKAKEMLQSIEKELANDKLQTERTNQ